MGIGTSLFLVAIGAILKYAITTSTNGVNLDTVGLILMLVGVIGLLISLLWVTIYSDRRRGAVVDGPVADRQRADY